MSKALQTLCFLLKFLVLLWSESKKENTLFFFKQQIILIGIALTMMIVGTGLWGKAKDSVRGDNLCSFKECVINLLTTYNTYMQDPKW